MKQIRTFIFFLLVATPFIGGCSDAADPVPNDTLDVPPVYSFESRFTPGASSVSYPGQTVRNLLMQDLKGLISAQSTSEARVLTLDDLLALYEHQDDAALSTTTSTGALPPLEESYREISTGKNLSGKVAPATLAGTGMTVDAQLRIWFDSIVAYSNDPVRRGTSMAYTTEAGLDLSQLVDKVLLGALAYYQGTTFYLGELTSQDNGSQKGTNPYTAMEHSWDEAFGYFGAARDYDRYSDAMLAGSPDDYTFDSNGDNAIDFRSEFNFPFARNAGKRDAGSSSPTDFSGDLFESFRTGRALIASEGALDRLLEERSKVARTWEKVIGATVVHYINDVIADMDGLTEESRPSNQPTLNKHWAEMKGYLWALQFNALGRISTSQVTSWQATVGDAPVYAMPGSTEHSEYVAALRGVRDEIGSALAFDADDVTVW